MFFSVYTLGCKLNQIETEAIADSFCREGFTLVPWEDEDYKPAIMLINTCTVTSMAEQKARRVIRKALRDQSEACVIVTGCYAQMDGSSLAAIGGEGRLFIVPGEVKDRLLDLAGFLSQAAEENRSAMALLIASWLKAGPNSDSGSGAFRFCPSEFSSHSRAFLKIQDGCDNNCSYCRIRVARGSSISLDSREVLKQLLALEQRGYAEAVLTGVNISQYRDPHLKFTLTGLLDFLLKETGKIRLRLSSLEIEGEEIEESGKSRKSFEAFIKTISNKRIRPHFHLSVQSGSAAILAKMGRSYSPKDIEKAAGLFRQVREDPFLACDLIAGFPGETERDFEETLELCGKVNFAWIHSFPFSPRQGTAAFTLPGKIAEREKKRRAELLSALARKGRLEYIRRWEGKEVEAVVEAGGDGGFVPAVSENYLKLLVKCGSNPVPAPGHPVKCRILRREDTRFDALAEIIANEATGWA